jgi:hypothetical protein
MSRGIPEILQAMPGAQEAKTHGCSGAMDAATVARRLSWAHGGENSGDFRAHSWRRVGAFRSAQDGHGHLTLDRRKSGLNQAGPPRRASLERKRVTRRGKPGRAAHCTQLNDSIRLSTFNEQRDPNAGMERVEQEVVVVHVVDVKVVRK